MLTPTSKNAIISYMEKEIFSEEEIAALMGTVTSETKKEQEENLDALPVEELHELFFAKKKEVLAQIESRGSGGNFGLLKNTVNNLGKEVSSRGRENLQVGFDNNIDRAFKNLHKAFIDTNDLERAIQELTKIYDVYQEKLTVPKRKPSAPRISEDQQLAKELEALHAERDAIKLSKVKEEVAGVP